ncbi:MAG TPA: hypothetical protein VK730_14205 [Solirubrobacteraceae bacterium]|nr:hypothetical protein [Solirubrobacteraceae bacterium]
MTRAYRNPTSCPSLALALSALVVLGATGCGSSSSPAKAAAPTTSVASSAETTTAANTSSSSGEVTPGHGAPNPLQPGEHIDKLRDNTIETSAIPPGQSVRGDGDADNPSDIDGNGDADGNGDNDNDNPTPQSYRFPDADDRATFAYGHAASAAETKQITGIVTRYFAAGAHSDGALACSLLAPTLAKSLAEDFGPGARPSYLHAGESCALVMAALFKHQHAQLAGAAHVVEVRVEGQTAQVIVTSRTMPAGQILLIGEGGRWRIEQLFAAALP